MSFSLTNLSNTNNLPNYPLHVRMSKFTMTESFPERFHPSQEIRTPQWGWATWDNGKTLYVESSCEAEAMMMAAFEGVDPKCDEDTLIKAKKGTGFATFASEGEIITKENVFDSIGKATQEMEWDLIDADISELSEMVMQNLFPAAGD